MHLKTHVLPTIIAALLGTTHAMLADEPDIGKALKSKGADITETKGVITSLAVKDGTKLTDADFAQIGRLVHLKSLSLNDGIDDARLAGLATLANLERLQTNAGHVSDDGLKPIARLSKLQTLALFHPGKDFSGAGLAHLESLPNLERLTVAGSFAFTDAGLAAVARLQKLKEFRTWHAGGTNQGIKKLTALKTFKSLYLGQRLTYKGVACPDDETIAIVKEMKSLESLQLDESRFTLKALEQLKELPALKKLKLGGVDMPREEVERLRQALPQVQIEWTEPSEVYQKRIQALFGKR